LVVEYQIHSQEQTNHLLSMEQCDFYQMSRYVLFHCHPIDAIYVEVRSRMIEEIVVELLHKTVKEYYISNQ
jgi:hypothetical protein